MGASVLISETWYYLNCAPDFDSPVPTSSSTAAGRRAERVEELDTHHNWCCDAATLLVIVKYSRPFD
jgi:hypothetical protein